jgi:hypothetical protein
MGAISVLVDKKKKDKVLYTPYIYILQLLDNILICSCCFFFEWPKFRSMDNMIQLLDNIIKIMNFFFLLEYILI